MHTALNSAAGAGGDKSHLKDGWGSVWSALSQNIPNLSTMLNIIGGCLFVGALIGYVWQRRRGGGNTNALLWTMVIGGMCSAPGLLIPVFLGIADGIINFAGGIANQST